MEEGGNGVGDGRRGLVRIKPDTHVGEQRPGRQQRRACVRRRRSRGARKWRVKGSRPAWGALAHEKRVDGSRPGGGALALTNCGGIGIACRRVRAPCHACRARAVVVKDSEQATRGDNVLVRCTPTARLKQLVELCTLIAGVGCLKRLVRCECPGLLLS